MLKCIKDREFLDLSYNEKRSAVLSELDNLVTTNLNKIGIKLYTPLTLNEKTRLLYKETKNDYLVSTLIRDVFLSLELIQNKEILIDRKSLDIIETFFKYSKYQVNRIGSYPLFTYDKDGNISKIELTNRNTRINVLCSLIDTIETRQPEIKKSLKKTL